MILEKILQFFIGILSVLIDFFPVIDVPMGVLEGAYEVLEVFRKFEYYLPCTTFLACLGVYTVATKWTFIVWCVNWVIKRITEIIP